jgi:hypothetical protein
MHGFARGPGFGSGLLLTDAGGVDDESNHAGVFTDGGCNLAWTKLKVYE